MNGDYAKPKTATVGSYLSDVLASEGKYVDINGTRTLISSLTSTKVESGRNYVVYSEIRNTAGQTLIGVVGTKVVDTKANFLAGTYTASGAQKTSDVTFPKAAATTAVNDGYYQVKVNGTDYYIDSTTNINVGSSGYAMVDGVIMPYGDIEGGAMHATKDMVITTGYYELTFTDAATPIGGTASWSDKVVEQGGKYYAQAGKVTLTISDATFTVASDNCLKVTNATVTDVSISDGTMNGDAAGSSNGITFDASQTYTGSFTLEVTVGAADVAVSLAWTASL